MYAKQPLLGKSSHRRLLGNWGFINEEVNKDGIIARAQT
ncbi:hypothetical protein PthstB1num2_05360 [Parageobacillus thermoglucosidasius]|uniref:Uncharacterized protein n=1 Tax=Geobacillus sp. (strain Y4.1MC1) TaxID=581103 RepID=A0A7U3YGS7_GEOS0|nr:hypothetical protein Geoth_2652 [Parageobacillus thermoglucosidasius C56-YS93]KYD14753.1 hypothetical protein B4168_1962 [Anoxybacillus flavithermus]OAO85619.1 hypothetical protein GT23_2522 [Parageobacillus thermoglucosidasius]GCD83304.1 hypothetical protein PTHTG4_23670 [Parageobacillus thermoglucosidasius]GMN98496.1 hypothetical protein PthstB1num2_05360 [Parageobacillus thermoglucosidasius]